MTTFVQSLSEGHVVINVDSHEIVAVDQREVYYHNDATVNYIDKSIVGDAVDTKMSAKYDNGVLVLSLSTGTAGASNGTGPDTKFVRILPVKLDKAIKLADEKVLQRIPKDKLALVFGKSGYKIFSDLASMSQANIRRILHFHPESDVVIRRLVTLDAFDHDITDRILKAIAESDLLFERVLTAALMLQSDFVSKVIKYCRRIPPVDKKVLTKYVTCNDQSAEVIHQMILKGLDFASVPDHVIDVIYNYEGELGPELDSTKVVQLVKYRPDWMSSMSIDLDAVQQFISTNLDKFLLTE